MLMLLILQLMVEHDLRAIDIRHTLPNLKNLLLTLTDGEVVPVGSVASRDNCVAILTLVMCIALPPSVHARHPRLYLV